MIDAKFINNSGQYTGFDDFTFVPKAHGTSDIETLDGFSRVSQDLRKIIQTPIGSLPYWNCGCLLPLIMLQPSGGTELASDVQSSIIDAIKFLKVREPSTDPDEIIAQIDQCSVTIDSTDSRQYDVVLQITTQSGLNKSFNVGS